MAGRTPDEPEESEFAAMLRATASNTTTTTNLSGIFKQEPVTLTVFLQDKAFLNNPPLSEVQYDAVRHIERIYNNDLYDRMALEFEGKRQVGSFMVGAYSHWRAERYWGTKLRMINFATLQWGKGSGKDHVARVASMRIAYLLLCLQSPQEYYGMPKQDTIHLLNVASSSQQAQQAFFTPITRAVKDSTFFRDLCQPRQNVISLASNIEMISGHSDAETQEGLNLLLGIGDEIDAFRSKKESQARRGASAREPTKSAESIIKMMRTSGATRFPATFKNVYISFPRYLGSMIQQLTESGKKDIAENQDKSRFYVSGPLATWQVNPRVPGRHAFASDYKEDPVMARAMYECKPARAINPYFRNKAAVDSCFTVRDTFPIGVTYGLEEGARQPVWVPRYEFSDDFYPVRGAAYSMHADLAISGDRAGIAMAHVVKYAEHQTLSQDEDGATHALVESRPHVKVDFVIPFTADIGADPPREIQIRWARQLCMELIRRGFNVQRFSFDGFQSADSMQILEARGIDTERVSTDMSEDPWRTLRDMMYEGRIEVPRPPVPEHRSFLLRDELLSLTRLPNGRVDHPADGSKDLADALSCAVFGAIQIGGAEEDSGARATYSEADIQVGSVFELPFGVSARGLWEREPLSPFEI